MFALEFMNLLWVTLLLIFSANMKRVNFLILNFLQKTILFVVITTGLESSQLQCHVLVILVQAHTWSKIGRQCRLGDVYKRWNRKSSCLYFLQGTCCGDFQYGHRIFLLPDFLLLFSLWCMGTLGHPHWLCTGFTAASVHTKHSAQGTKHPVLFLQYFSNTVDKCFSVSLLWIGFQAISNLIYKSVGESNIFSYSGFNCTWIEACPFQVESCSHSWGVPLFLTASLGRTFCLRSDDLTCTRCWVDNLVFMTFDFLQEINVTFQWHKLAGNIRYILLCCPKSGQ